MGPRKISNKDQAKDYYYERDHFHSFDESRWFGELCELFQFSGNVQKDDFFNALDGKNKEGVQLLRDYQDRRIGVDFVFEAPKSVSMAIRLLGDDRLIEAIDDSLDVTLNKLEKEAIYTRCTDNNGCIIRINTGQMIAAIYPHSTSRSCIDQNDDIQPPDMHEHRHVVIMNCTLSPKNKWNALDNEPIFLHQRYFNCIFQSELAKRVQSSGYGIILKANGNWEIAGFDQKWIDNFSKRHFAIDVRFKELKESMKYPKKSDAELRDIAANETRLDKNMNYTPPQLIQIWSEQVDPELIRENVEKCKHEQQLPNSDIIKDACVTLHKKTSTFTLIELKNTMLQLSRGVYGIDEIETIIEDVIKTGFICFVGKKTVGKYYEYETFATQEMIELEQKIIDAVNNGFGTQKELVDEVKINETFMNHQYLSNEQVDAIESILSSTDKYNFIQGDAGTGKTTAMKVINDALKDSHCKITGLTYTGKAALELQQKASFDCLTLDSFFKKPSLSPFDSHLLIIDESSMLDSFKFGQLIDFAEKDTTIRMLFVGDWKQLQAIGAGRLYSDMVTVFNHKMIEITEAKRFQTEMMTFVAACLKEYQEDINPNGINQVIEMLELNKLAIFESDNTKLVDQLVTDFMIKSDESLIVCASNEDKDFINRLCKMALQESGQIELEDMTIKSIKEKDMPLIGANFSNQFRPGDKIFIERASGLSAHQIAEVQTISGKHTIIIRINGFITHEIDLNKDRIRGIEERTIDVSVGTKVVFTRNDYRLGVRNGTSGKIVSINQETKALEIDTGADELICINSEYGHIDLGYAVTAYKAQGMDAESVMVYVTGASRGMLNSELFYVSCTRASHELRIYSDSKDILINAINKHQYKATTLDLSDCMIN